MPLAPPHALTTLRAADCWVQFIPTHVHEVLFNAFKVPLIKESKGGDKPVVADVLLSRFGEFPNNNWAKLVGWVGEWDPGVAEKSMLEMLAHPREDIIMHRL